MNEQTKDNLARGIRVGVKVTILFAIIAVYASFWIRFPIGTLVFHAGVIGFVGGFATIAWAFNRGRPEQTPEERWLDNRNFEFDDE